MSILDRQVSKIWSKIDSLGVNVSLFASMLCSIFTCLYCIIAQYKHMITFNYVNFTNYYRCRCVNIGVIASSHIYNVLIYVCAFFWGNYRMWRRSLRCRLCQRFCCWRMGKRLTRLLEQRRMNLKTRFKSTKLSYIDLSFILFFNDKEKLGIILSWWWWWL